MLLAAAITVSRT